MRKPRKPEKHRDKYTPEQEEFFQAVEKWKVKNPRQFPPLHVYFDIMIELGYRKVK
jgi:hypothetical protein